MPKEGQRSMFRHREGGRSRNPMPKEGQRSMFRHRKEEELESRCLRQLKKAWHGGFAKLFKKIEKFLKTYTFGCSGEEKRVL